MPIFKELPAAKRQLYLEVLAETDRYADAVKATAIDPSLPHYWRRTDATFVNAETVAKQKAAEKVLAEGRARRQKRG